MRITTPHGIKLYLRESDWTALQRLPNADQVGRLAALKVDGWTKLSAVLSATAFVGWATISSNRPNVTSLLAVQVAVLFGLVAVGHLFPALAAVMAPLGRIYFLLPWHLFEAVPLAVAIMKDEIGGFAAVVAIRIAAFACDFAVGMARARQVGRSGTADDAPPSRAEEAIFLQSARLIGAGPPPLLVRPATADGSEKSPEAQGLADSPALATSEIPVSPSHSSTTDDGNTDPRQASAAVAAAYQTCANYMFAALKRSKAEFDGGAVADLAAEVARCRRNYGDAVVMATLELLAATAGSPAYEDALALGAELATDSERVEAMVEAIDQAASDARRARLATEGLEAPLRPAEVRALDEAAAAAKAYERLMYEMVGRCSAALDLASQPDIGAILDRRG